MVELTTKAQKLIALCASKGYDDPDDAYAAVSDDTAPGICMNDGCNFISDVRLQEKDGYCEACDDCSVRSILFLIDATFEKLCEIKGRTALIRGLNDTLRSTFTGGRVVTSAGVASLPDEVRAQVFAKVRSFDQFNGGNDPHDEHDFAGFEFNGQTYFWKIDYYDERMKWGSDDPADPKKTTRVLTIMLSDEY
jgi:uncharacterized protein DUF3768